jgi:RNA-directed DNA polymerase
VSSSRDEHRRQTDPDRVTDGQGRAVKPAGTDQRAEPSPARDGGKSDAEVWERIWERSNMFQALQRVERNQGAAGIDGMRVEELRSYLKAHWLEVCAALESGQYRPSPVRRVEIPKPDGGVRQLGIPIRRSYCTSYNGL